MEEEELKEELIEFLMWHYKEEIEFAEISKEDARKEFEKIVGEYLEAKKELGTE